MAIFEDFNPKLNLIKQEAYYRFVESRGGKVQGGGGGGVLRVLQNL